MYGIAGNLVMKHLRSNGRQRDALLRLATRGDGSQQPFDERVTDVAANAQLLSEVAEVIRDLPDRDREVVFLFAWEELSYTEIAEALDTPVGTVRSRLNRVRTSLRELAPSAGKNLICQRRRPAEDEQHERSTRCRSRNGATGRNPP